MSPVVWYRGPSLLSGTVAWQQAVGGESEDSGQWRERWAEPARGAVLLKRRQGLKRSSLRVSAADFNTGPPLRREAHTVTRYTAGENVEHQLEALCFRRASFCDGGMRWVMRSGGEAELRGLLFII